MHAANAKQGSFRHKKCLLKMLVDYKFQANIILCEHAHEPVSTAFLGYNMI